MPNTRSPYLTPQNHQQKLTEWQSALAPFEKRKNKLDINNSALLVIDMQDFFLEEKSHAYTATGTIVDNNIKELIQKFRAANRPVIFTYFSVKPGEADPHGRWWHNKSITSDKIINSLEVLPTDLILRKNTYSTFHSPENQKLRQLLKETNTSQVVISGILTNLCCETTAREAFHEDYDIFMPMDATATRNEEFHLASLKNLAFGFATIPTTNELLK